MSVEDKKAKVRRLIEEFINKGDLAVADEIFASNFVNHDDTAGTTQERQGFKQYITMVRTACPDFHCTIEDLITEGDRVMVRLMCCGTHSAEFMGISPTGRQWNVTSITILRFDGDGVAERWNVTGNLGILQQIDVFSLPSQAGR